WRPDRAVARDRRSAGARSRERDRDADVDAAAGSPDAVHRRGRRCGAIAADAVGGTGRGRCDFGSARVTSVRTALEDPMTASAGRAAVRGGQALAGAMATPLACGEGFRRYSRIRTR